MSISIRELFAAAAVAPEGVVKWKNKIPADVPGIYCVSWSADPDATDVDKESYVPSPIAYAQLLSARQDLSVDGIIATPISLAERLGHFWLPNEPILYIGKAGTSLRTRIGQHYSTKLGARSPHSGGWWLKTLDGLDEMYVHFATCDDVAEREQSMLAKFASSISPAHRSQLFDTERVAPFANVDTAKGLNKRHGMLNFKGDIAVATDGSTVESTYASTVCVTQLSDCIGVVKTQPVTDKDRTRSYIRIPAESKHVFPSSPARVKIILDGILAEVAWRPNGTRSGTLGVGVEYMRSLLERGDRLQISVHNGTYTVHRM